MRLLTLVSALLFPVAAFAADPPAKPSAAEHGQPHSMAACAKACVECAMVCDNCIAHCAQSLADGKKEHLKTLQTCQDCAAICATAAGIMGRNGPFSDTISIACADACKRCGDACEAMKDDAMMKKCAEECRKCEAACRTMLKAHGDHKH